MQHQAKTDLLQRLEAGDYSQKDIIVLTIPIALPYPVQQSGYERVNGEFEYKGEHYKLAKQKLENDTLFLVCVKDHEAKKLAVAMADYSKLANNLPAGSKQALSFLGKLFKDFNASDIIRLTAIDGWQQAIGYAAQHFTPVYNNYPVDSPPPEVLS